MDVRQLMDSSLEKETIRKWRADGKKALGIVCCHVPFELLHAAGVLPVRLRATSCESYAEAEQYLNQKSCGFSMGIFQLLMDGTYELDGMVSSNGCTDASAVYSAWVTACKKEGKEQFIFDVDAPRMLSKASKNYFRRELEALKEELEKFTGREITNEMLKNSVDTYNEARRIIRKIYDLHMADNPVVTGEETLRVTLKAAELPIEEYVELLKAFLEEAQAREPKPGKPARVMLVGSALDRPDFVHEIESFGCMVVADLNSFGLRFLRNELAYDEADVLGSLSEYYMSRSSCPRMMDGSDDIDDYVLRSAEEFNVDGVILERLSFCDKWKIQGETMSVMLKEKGIPYLELERVEQNGALGQLSLRVEAFREMIENDRD